MLEQLRLDANSRLAKPTDRSGVAVAAPSHSSHASRASHLEAGPEGRRPPMKKLALFVLVFAAAIAAWAPAGLAQQTTPGGGGDVQMTTGAGSGQTSGVTITNNDRLLVGTVPNVETDILTNNTNNAIGPYNSTFAVRNTIASEGRILFQSTSTVFGAIGSTGNLLSISTNAGTTVTFLGTVDSTTVNVGAGTVNFNNGSVNNVTNLIFTGDGTISLSPGTSITPGALTTITDNTGTLVLGSGSNLVGAAGGPAATFGLKNITVTGGSNTAGVNATIGGAVNAYTFNLNTNTLNITGALTVADLGAGGVINTTLATGSPSGVGTYGNIVTAGAANLPVALSVVVTVPSTAIFGTGAKFIIVNATGALTGATAVTVTDAPGSNPLYTFSETTTANQVYLLTTGTPLNTSSLPLVPILITVASGLPATSTLVQAVTAINALTTPAAVANAIAQLSPSAADLAAPLVTFQATQEFENLWMSRLDDVMCGEVSERRPGEDVSMCRKDDPHDGWWMKGFGYVGDQGPQGTLPGYNSSIAGAMVAYDAPIIPLRDASLGLETRMGVGIGYARSQIDGSPIGTGSSNTNFNTYQATAYISQERGPWFVDGAVSFGWNDYSGTRNISFTGFSQTANAGYSGQDYTAFATTGYHFRTQGFSITPIASLQYTHVNLDGYTETGAGDVDLKVNAQGYDFVQSGLGVKVARPFAYHDDGTYVPEVHFKWLHELYNPTLQNTATFTATGSTPFITPGFNQSDDTYNIGAGFTFLSCACTARTWALEAVYNYYWTRDNYSANEGMIKFTSRF